MVRSLAQGIEAGSSRERSDRDYRRKAQCPLIQLKMVYYFELGMRPKQTHKPSAAMHGAFGSGLNFLAK